MPEQRLFTCRGIGRLHCRKKIRWRSCPGRFASTGCRYQMCSRPATGRRPASSLGNRRRVIAGYIAPGTNFNAVSGQWQVPQLRWPARILCSTGNSPLRFLRTHAFASSSSQDGATPAGERLSDCRIRTCAEAKLFLSRSHSLGPNGEPLKPNALDPKLSCSCQEDAAAGVASDPAAADVHGCFPPVADSAAATVSDSQDVPLATASDFPKRPGDTRRQSQVSCGDNRCGADVGTPAYRRRLAGDGRNTK